MLPNLAHFLKNRLYIGETGHKDKWFPGEHASHHRPQDLQSGAAIARPRAQRMIPPYPRFKIYIRKQLTRPFVCSAHPESAMFTNITEYRIMLGIEREDGFSAAC
jgi:hypothetical protein